MMFRMPTRFERLPIEATRTVTFEQGSEFADFRLFECRRKYHHRRIKTYQVAEKR